MSLYSMTAFARESTPAMIVELRSVNQRYLDCHFKLPDSLRALEPKLRDQLGTTLKRGKIDVQVRLLDAATQGTLNIDEERLGAVLAALAHIKTAAPEVDHPDALALLQFPGVTDGASDDEEAINRAALDLFDSALKGLTASRAREGAQLSEFLHRRLEAINHEVDKVEAELPVLRARQEERLRKRLAELDQPADEGRVEQELVLLLQKSDVDEELDRLRAHVEEVTRILNAGGPCGRRLDFLMQELNREANTLSSKAIAASTTQSAVELKVLIEQMREQVQNIE